MLLKAEWLSREFKRMFFCHDLKPSKTIFLVHMVLGSVRHTNSPFNNHFKVNLIFIAKIGPTHEEAIREKSAFSQYKPDPEVNPPIFPGNWRGEKKARRPEKVAATLHQEWSGLGGHSKQESDVEDKIIETTHHYLNHYRHYDYLSYFSLWVKREGHWCGEGKGPFNYSPEKRQPEVVCQKHTMIAL